MPFYASKLPFAFEVDHNGQNIILNGSNVGEELDNPSKNGMPREHRSRVYGFGLTELSDKQADAFAAWKESVTMHDGQKVEGGFTAFDNGAILGPFKTAKDAEAECAALSSAINTGFEGFDGEKEEAEANEKMAKRAKD